MSDTPTRDFLKKFRHDTSSTRWLKYYFLTYFKLKYYSQHQSPSFVYKICNSSHPTRRKELRHTSETCGWRTGVRHVDAGNMSVLHSQKQISWFKETKNNIPINRCRHDIWPIQCNACYLQFMTFQRLNLFSSNQIPHKNKSVHPSRYDPTFRKLIIGLDPSQRPNKTSVSQQYFWQGVITLVGFI